MQANIELVFEPSGNSIALRRVRQLLQVFFMLLAQFAPAGILLGLRSKLLAQTRLIGWRLRFGVLQFLQVLVEPDDHTSSGLARIAQDLQRDHVD